MDGGELIRGQTAKEQEEERRRGRELLASPVSSFLNDLALVTEWK